MRNGVLMMGAAAGAILLYTHGDVSKLVVLYAINVFITFSLSNIAMTVFWVRQRRSDPKWVRHLPAHMAATVLCLTILAITILTKFMQGAWLTVVVTTGLTLLCYLVRRHHRRVVRAIRRLDSQLPGPEAGPEARALYGDLPATPAEGEPDPAKPVVVLFVWAWRARAQRGAHSAADVPGPLRRRGVREHRGRRFRYLQGRAGDRSARAADPQGPCRLLASRARPWTAHRQPQRDRHRSGRDGREDQQGAARGLSEGAGGRWTGDLRRRHSLEPTPAQRDRVCHSTEAPARVRAHGGAACPAGVVPAALIAGHDPWWERWGQALNLWCVVAFRSSQTCQISMTRPPP